MKDREEVYDELDSNYNSSGGSIAPAVKLAREQDENLEDIVLGYIERKLGSGTEEDEKIAQKIAEDYESITEAFDIEVGRDFQEVRRDLEEA